MAKNHRSLQSHPKQQTPASPAHTYTASPATVSAAGAETPMPTTEDDEDNDVCISCDGDCTCGARNRPLLLPSSPLAQPAASASTPAPLPRLALGAPFQLKSSSQQQASQPLKIRLTVPPSFLAKHAKRGKATANESPVPSTVPRKRGRPPKIVPPAPALDSEADGVTPTRPAPKRKAASKARKGSGTTGTNKGKNRAPPADDGHGSGDEYDVPEGQFPDFISASALSSLSSSELSYTDSSESGSENGFGTDSSMEAEEETYILTEERRKARARRELLGDDNKRHQPKNDWVIRPRKKSVGLSEAEMDVDSDATEDEDEDEEEDEEDEEEAETADAEADVEVEGRYGYSGLVTGWSEDEESSLDADLFFANLSDSDSSEDGGPTHAAFTLPESGMQSDADDTTSTDAQEPAFEVSQGWDGQLVFTTGVAHELDAAFEASAALLVAEDSTASASASPEQEDRDTDMDVDDDADEDTHGLRESDGETTEDELVGADGLPTQKAMALFRWPSSVSAINPLSTMSPNSRVRRRAPSSTTQSPRPSDILSGQSPIFYDDSDEHDVPDAERREQPAMGEFAGVQRSAIIGGERKEVPSPYPKRTRSGSRGGRSSLGQLDLRGRALSIASSLSGLHVKSPELTSPSLQPTAPIELDDVLDASFLADPPPDSSAASEPEPASLSRWDRVPMGTFRRTRDPAGATDDGGSGAEGAMKPSPFGRMLARRVTLPTAATATASVPTSGASTPTSAGKTRKELRREKKLRRKGPVHHYHQHHNFNQAPQHHFHHHQHHPNMKSRSTNAMQRTNFVGSPAEGL